jgi:transcriptional regulator with XRE-family HTH domain
MIGESPADQPASTFAVLLKQLRAEARLTQEELAYAAGLSPRSISDLERGISRTARKDTALLLADALAIGGSARATFVAAARGKAAVSEVLAARDAVAADSSVEATRRYRRVDRRASPSEIELRKLIDAMTAATASDGSVITGFWLIGLTAQAAPESSATWLLTASGCCGRFRGRSRVVQCRANGHSEIQSGRRRWLPESLPVLRSQEGTT